LEACGLIQPQAQHARTTPRLARFPAPLLLCHPTGRLLEGPQVGVDLQQQGIAVGRFHPLRFRERRHGPQRELVGRRQLLLLQIHGVDQAGGQQAIEHRALPAGEYID